MAGSGGALGTDGWALADLVQVRTSKRFGSGLLIAPGIVLTALHCIADPDNGWAVDEKLSVNLWRELFHPREAERRRQGYLAKLIWPPTIQKGINPPDIALLQVQMKSDKPVPSPKRMGPLFYADLDMSDSDVVAAGFPESLEEEDGRRPEGSYPGKANLFQRSSPTISFTSRLIHSEANWKAWSGLSGGPLFRNDAVVGVMRACQPRFKLDRNLEAEPLAPLLRDPRYEGLAKYFKDIADVLRTYREALDDEPAPPAIHLPRTVVRLSIKNDFPGPEFSAMQPGPRTFKEALTVRNAELNLEKALTDTHKIVLLGDPGMGKSTALRDLDRAGLPWTPIRIDLRFYDGQEEMEVLLARRVNEVLRRRGSSLTPCAADAVPFLQDQLVRKDQCDFIFLLDGLDEVKPEHHERIRQAIKGLLAYRHRCVISCRVTDYDSFFDQTAVPYVLEDLKPEDIRFYLTRVLGDARGRGLFDQHIRRDTQILSLATNPLLLSLIAKIAEVHPEARIPSQRAILFQAFVDALPSLKASEGGRLGIPRDVVYSALEGLGFAMAKHSTYDAGLSDVRQWDIPAAAGHTIDAILGQAHECRLLLSDGERGDSVQFIHPLFRDYFAARLLKRRFDPLAAQCVRNGVKLDELVETIWTPRWDQSVLMLATILERPADFIVRIADKTRLSANMGTLFIGGPLYGLRFWMLSLSPKTRSQQLLECWRNSRAAVDREVTASVVGALRAVVRHCKSALRFDSAPAAAEALAAIDGLMEIRDGGAIPDLEGLLNFFHGPYRFPPPNRYSSSMNEAVAERARTAITRLRGG